MCRHDGHIRFLRYDANHRLVEEIDFGGNKTLYERDAFGRIVAITDPTGAITRFEYEDIVGHGFHEPARVIRPDGVAAHARGAGDRLTRTMTDGEGRTSTVRSDAFGNMTEVVDASGSTVRFHYDGQERLVRVTNQTGLDWTFERDGAGRVVREHDFSGLETRYEYDKVDRLVASTHSDRTIRRYAWDGSNLLTRQTVRLPDGDVRETSYRYDDRGLLVEARNADAWLQFERDALGRVTAEITDSHRIESDFDCCGNRTERRIVASERCDPGRAESDVEEALRAIAAINAERESKRRPRDPGEVIARAAFHFPMGGLRSLRLGEHAPLRFERDARGYEVRHTNDRGFDVAQEHDEVGQLVAQRSAASSGVPSLASPSDPAPALDRIERRYEWSRAYEPTTIDDAIWGERRFAYNRDGQVASASHGDGAVERFDYDHALNLVAAGGGRPPAADDRLPGRPLDAAANLHSFTTAPGGRIDTARGPNGERVTLVHDERSRLVRRRVERDGFRMREWRYRWEDERLVACTTPEGERWSYGYDAFARRAWKRREDAPTGEGRLARSKRVARIDYVWDGDTVALEIARNADGGAIARTEWVHEPDGFAPLAKRTLLGDGPDAVHYAVTDHLGTPRELVGEDGAIAWARDHTVWGATRGERAANDNLPDGPSPPRIILTGTGPAIASPEAPQTMSHLHPCPIGFPGQWSDPETGLSYNRHRHYDALTGQYASPDPIGILGGTRSHSYVISSSYETDPFGLQRQPCCCGLIRYRIREGLTPQPGARATAIARAWRLEQRLVEATGYGTVDWTAAQRTQLLSTGSVTGFTGHHINNVAQFPAWQADPRNIVFLSNSPNGGEHLNSLQGHRGAWQNETSGRLIDREAMIQRHEREQEC